MHIQHAQTRTNIYDKIIAKTHNFANENET